MLLWLAMQTLLPILCKFSVARSAEGIRTTLNECYEHPPFLWGEHIGPVVLRAGYGANTRHFRNGCCASYRSTQGEH